MELKETDPTYLRRIDSSQNMRRFYTITIQPTLFGGVSVIRNWGRIGTNGQSMMETFDNEDAAATASIRIQTAKRRKGYRDSDPAEGTISSLGAQFSVNSPRTSLLNATVDNTRCDTESETPSDRKPPA